MPATFGRISRPYSDISGCIRMISQMCSHIAVYQHDADEDINRTHCHYVAIHSCDQKTIKNNIQAGVKPGDKFSGNTDWSHKDWDKDHTTLIYMTKGNIDPSYIQGFTLEEIEEAKRNWKEEEPKVKNQKVNKLFKIYKEILSDNWKSHISRWDEIPNKIEDVKLNLIQYPRFQVIKVFFWNRLRHDYSHIYPMVSPQMKKDRRTMVETFCYNENVFMPPAKDSWDSLE